MFHSYEIPVKGQVPKEEVKIIEVFAEKELAEATAKDYKSLPGFREYPNGFHVSKYNLNQKWWTEGFIKV
uniref:DUF7336 domain-containing protein n=1 Tax=Sporomusa rhizae TaxID=357999 RepID=UPI003FA1F819